MRAFVCVCVCVCVLSCFVGISRPMLVNVGCHYAFVLFPCMSTYAFPIFLYLKEKSKFFIYTYIQMTIALVDKVVTNQI